MRETKLSNVRAKFLMMFKHFRPLLCQQDSEKKITRKKNVSDVTTHKNYLGS